MKFFLHKDIGLIGIIFFYINIISFVFNYIKNKYRFANVWFNLRDTLKRKIYDIFSKYHFYRYIIFSVALKWAIIKLYYFISVFII